MTDAEIASQIVSSASVLAGLLLVFLGAVFSAFNSYDAEQKSYVRRTYQWRGATAFVGFVCSVLAAGGALLSSWFQSFDVLFFAKILLVMAFVAMIDAAFRSMWDLFK